MFEVLILIADEKLRGKYQDGFTRGDRWFIAWKGAQICKNNGFPDRDLGFRNALLIVPKIWFKIENGFCRTSFSRADYALIDTARFYMCEVILFW